MISCDKLLVSQVAKNISYNDITLHTGIANNIRTFEYSGEEVYFPDGRGYFDFVDFIRKIGIKFREISVKDLEHKKENENTIVFIPKEMLEIAENNIVTKTNYVNLIYSAFNVKPYDAEHILLRLVANRMEYQEIISFAKLQKLYELKSKPLSYTVKIIVLEKQLHQMDIIKTKEHLENNFKLFLTNSKKNCGETVCCGGPQFYKNFYDIFVNMIENTDKKYNKLKAFIFIKAFNAGSEAFFRTDFVAALEENKLGLNNINREIEDLRKAAKGWCEIARILRGVQNGNDFCLNKSKIKTLLLNIENIELETVNNLLNKM